MQVLMVTPSYYPIKGGAETVVRTLSVELNKVGVKTDVLTFNMNRKWNPYWRGKTEKIGGINVFKIPGLNWYPITHTDRITLGINLIPGRFRHYLKQYDIIHFHGADLTLPLFSYRVKKPKVFHSHGFTLDFYERYFLSRLILKNIAEIYIAITKNMRNEFLVLGLPKNKIRVLPNGVDVKTFQPSGRKTDNLLLFVGRIAFGKGLHILLESLRYLKQTIHLAIIGPPAETKYFKDILMRIKNENEKGIHEITYLGEQEPANIVEWYQKASILVLPSLREAFPVVTLEALACETPVIASNVGGVAEVVKHGRNGILVPPNNPVKLAEAIQYLLNNSDVRTGLGREGRKYVVENFSIDVIINKLLKIYEELLTERCSHVSASRCANTGRIVKLHSWKLC